MSNDQAIAFVLFAASAAITPGPSNVILASTGASAGVIRGISTLLGVTLGMGFMIFIVSIGLGTLVTESSLLLELLKWGGVCFLLRLSWMIATAPPRIGATTRSDVIGFWRAAAFQWVNPKSWLISASIAGTYLGATNNELIQSSELAVLFAAAALPSCGVWLAFGAGLERVLQTERAMRIFNIATAILLASSIALFIL